MFFWLLARIALSIRQRISLVISSIVVWVIIIISKHFIDWRLNSFNSWHNSTLLDRYTILFQSVRIPIKKTEIHFWQKSTFNWIFLKRIFLFLSIWNSNGLPLLMNGLIDYLRVLTVWSAEEDPGEMQAIMTILDLSDLLENESLSTSVNLDALNGTWEAPVSIARMHSFNAKRLATKSAKIFKNHYLKVLILILLALPFVDFRSFHSPLPVVTLTILCSLWSS